MKYRIKHVASNMISFCDTQCPECGYIAKAVDYYDFDTVECPVCGYEKVSGSDGKKGFGVFYAEYKNKPFAYFIFEELPSDKEIENLLQSLKDDFVIKEKSYFYLYQDGKVKTLFGKNPKDFNTYLQEQEERLRNESLWISNDFSNTEEF